MKTLGLTLTVAIILVVAVLRNFDMVRSRSAARYLWAALAFLAIAMIVKTIEVPFGSNGLVLVVRHILGILAAFCVFRICEHLRGLPEAGAHMWYLYAVLVLVVSSGVFAKAFSWLWNIHWVVFSLYQGAALVTATIVCIRSSAARTGIIRWELRLIGVGTAIGVLYTAMECFAHVPETKAALEEMVRSLLAASIVLIALGTGGSSFYGWMRRRQDRDDLQRALTVIRPEWERVTASRENVILSPPPELLGIKDLSELRFWKTRMIIEIEDSLSLEG
jgi:hypothetical protein